MILEDFQQAPSDHLDALWAFLGRSPREPGARLGSGTSRTSKPSVRNAGTYPEMGKDTRRLLDEFFRPHNAILESVLGRKLPW